MNKFAKSVVLAVLVVVSFGVTHQTASARVVLPLDGSCPSSSPIRTQVDSSLVCLSLDEFCPTNNQWFMDYDSPLKCPDYQNNPSWIRYVATSTTVPSSSGSVTTTVPSSSGSVATTVPSSSGSVATTVPSSSGSSSSENSTTSPSKVVARTTTTTTQLDAVEDDGDSEEDFADLGISNKSGKFDMRVSSSFVETEMILRAYKKGSKSVTWNFTTNANGQYRIITSRLLKGFTMSLWIDGEKWDSLVVR